MLSCLFKVEICKIRLKRPGSIFDSHTESAGFDILHLGTFHLFKNKIINGYLFKLNCYCESKKADSLFQPLTGCAKR